MVLILSQEELTAMMFAEEKRLGVGSEEFLQHHNEIMELINRARRKGVYMAKKTGMPAFVKKGAQYMNVIKAIEDYSYYHKITGQSMDKWEKWRTEEVEKWHLDKAILGKGVAADGKADYECQGRYGGAGSV